MHRWTRMFIVLLSIAAGACDLRPTEPPPDPIPEPQPEPEPEPEPPPDPPVEPPPDPPVEPPPDPPVEPPPDPPVSAGADTLSAMTFNIYHDRANEQLRIAPWQARRDMVLGTIRDADADIVGLQEAYMWQVAWLVGQLSDYSYVGRGREADESGESVSILFDSDRFTLEDSGDFWLSPTPDVPGSTGGPSWGMTVPRLVTWARLGFVDNGRELYVYNTHLPPDEDGGPEARRRAAVLLADRIAARSSPEVPFVLLGDFNATEGEFPIRYLTRENIFGSSSSPVEVVDTWRQVHAGNQGTRCRNDSSGTPIVHGDRVDYVFAIDTTWTDGANDRRSTADEVLSSAVVTPTPSCASDHVAVLSRFVVP